MNALFAKKGIPFMNTVKEIQTLLRQAVTIPKEKAIYYLPHKNQ